MNAQHFEMDAKDKKLNNVNCLALQHNITNSNITLKGTCLQETGVHCWQRTGRLLIRVCSNNVYMSFYLWLLDRWKIWNSVHLSVRRSRFTWSHLSTRLSIRYLLIIMSVVSSHHSLLVYQSVVDATTNSRQSHPSIPSKG